MDDKLDWLEMAQAAATNAAEYRDEGRDDLAAVTARRRRGG